MENRAQVASNLLSTKLNSVHAVGGINCNICQNTFKDKPAFENHYLQHSTSKPIYTCVLCTTQFEEYCTFRDHCYRHAIRGRLKCNICSKTFSKPSILKEHQNTHNKTHSCTHLGPPPCDKSFSTRNELKNHMKLHNCDEPPYPCISCNKTIHSLDECQKHVELHAIFTYSCPICNDICQKELIREHLTIHFGNESVTEPSDVINLEDSSINIVGGILCHICTNKFKNRLDFDCHFKLEHPQDDITYSCIWCSKAFMQYLQLGNHCYNHSRNHKFICDRCGKSFSRLSLLASHSGVCASSDDDCRPFHCSMCETRFADDRRMRAHLRDAHNVLSYLCYEPGCGLEFEKPKDLFNHQVTHKKINNWCRTCGLEFATLIACESHIEIHKKKNYQCPICKHSYTEKHLALKHLPQHFQAVLHICKTCGNTYKARNRLIEHLKVHSEDKQLECTYCGKGFTKLIRYKEHLNTHTGNKPYACVACPKTFTNYPNWSKHMKKIHKLDPKSLRKNNNGANNNNNIDNVKFSEDSLDLDSIIPMIEAVSDDYLCENTNLDVCEQIRAAPVLLDQGLRNDQFNTTIESYSTICSEDILQNVDIDNHYFPIVDPHDHILPNINPLLTIKTPEINIYQDLTHESIDCIERYIF